MTKGRFQLDFGTDYGSSLQAVRQELVHLGDAGRDGKVDSAVANLDDESTDNVGVDLYLGLGVVSLGKIVRLEGGVPRW